jgi:predicted XRE-type DNA-binding protein
MVGRGMAGRSSLGRPFSFSFNDSEWKQQDIADVLDVTQSWVSRLLRFARFLFMTVGINGNMSELTEYRFREALFSKLRAAAPVE